MLARMPKQKSDCGRQEEVNAKLSDRRRPLTSVGNKPNSATSSRPGQHWEPRSPSRPFRSPRDGKGPLIREYDEYRYVLKGSSVEHDGDHRCRGLPGASRGAPRVVRFLERPGKAAPITSMLSRQPFRPHHPSGKSGPSRRLHSVARFALGSRSVRANSRSALRGMTIGRGPHDLKRRVHLAARTSTGANCHCRARFQRQPAKIGEPPASNCLLSHSPMNHRNLMTTVAVPEPYPALSGNVWEHAPGHSICPATEQPAACAQRLTRWRRSSGAEAGPDARDSAAMARSSRPINHQARDNRRPHDEHCGCHRNTEVSVSAPGFRHRHVRREAEASRSWQPSQPRSDRGPSKPRSMVQAVCAISGRKGSASPRDSGRLAASEPVQRYSSARMSAAGSPATRVA